MLYKYNKRKPWRAKRVLRVGLEVANKHKEDTGSYTVPNRLYGTRRIIRGYQLCTHIDEYKCHDCPSGGYLIGIGGRYYKHFYCPDKKYGVGNRAYYVWRPVEGSDHYVWRTAKSQAIRPPEEEFDISFSTA